MFDGRGSRFEGTSTMAVASPLRWQHHMVDGRGNMHVRSGAYLFRALARRDGRNMLRTCSHIYPHSHAMRTLAFKRESCHNTRIHTYVCTYVYAYVRVHVGVHAGIYAYAYISVHVGMQ